MVENEITKFTNLFIPHQETIRTQISDIGRLFDVVMGVNGSLF